jgi:predicted transcriptional regulator of viral defense system
MKIDNILKSFRKNPFTFQDALKRGLSRHGLRRLLERGAIERVSRGVYQCVDTDLTEEVQFKRATKIVGEPSAICLLSALSYFQLTDSIPNKVWIMVPADKRTSSDEVHLYRTRNPEWNVGIEQESGFWITTIERTLVDSITARSKLPLRLGLEGLKVGIEEGKTTISQVLDMSIALRVKDRILPYLEVLS